MDRRLRNRDILPVKIAAIATTLLGFPLGFVVWAIGGANPSTGLYDAQEISKTMTVVLCFGVPLSLWLVYVSIATWREMKDKERQR